jgi:hypothetical protein
MVANFLNKFVPFFLFGQFFLNVHEKLQTLFYLHVDMENTVFTEALLSVYALPVGAHFRLSSLLDSHILSEKEVLFREALGTGTF